MASNDASTTPQQRSWQQRACVFCGIDNCEVALSRPRYDIRRCPRCAVMWCDPMRFDDQFNADDEAAYIEVEKTISDENAGRLALLEQLAPPRTHPKVVEIGCMHGDFVRQMRAAGYDGVGLDLSHSAVRDAERLNPGCVRYGTLDSSVEDASLDVVAAFNVIEHMDAPHEFLDEVARVLRPGGVLILETPQQESLYHHVMFARGKLKPAAEKLEVGLHPGTHIFKYGRKAWEQILSDRDFELLAAEPKSTPLAELLKKKSDMPLGVRVGIVTVGAAARVTNLDNRILVVARCR